MKISTLVFLGLFLCFQNAWSKDLKIGLVNMQTVVGTVKEGKKAKKALEAFFKKRNKVLTAEGKKLEREFQDLQKRKGVLSQKAFQEQMSAHQNKKISYERAFAKAQVDLQKKERDLTIPILKKIEAVIKKLF